MINQKVPDVIFKTRVKDEFSDDVNPFVWKDLSSSEIFDNKKIIIFGLPAAFSPTCTNFHLPGYEFEHRKFKSLGIDDVYCVSVNDAFTMHQWSQSVQTKHIKFLPDGNADFTRLMGMLVQKNNFGYGLRSWRYSMLVTNTIIKKMFIEPGIKDNSDEDPYTCSDALTMLNYLKE